VVRRELYSNPLVEAQSHDVVPTRNEKVVGSIPTSGCTQTTRSGTTPSLWGFGVASLERLWCPSGARVPPSGISPRRRRERPVGAFGFQAGWLPACLTRPPTRRRPEGSSCHPRRGRGGPPRCEYLRRT
jgi:hypothetical protein